MGNCKKRHLSRWREKRARFSQISTAGGFGATVLFALYNAGLGIWYASLWHGSIGAYYILLSLLRGTLICAERSAGKKEREDARSWRKRVFKVTGALVLLMNAALAAPVTLMVLDRRPVRTGLIPAIASAAYTTYKISAAAVRLRRARGTILERELSMLRLVDALASVLVLQNTLIIAVEGGISREMFRLAAISSGVILLLIFALSALWFARGRRALD